jgi:thioredoxin reductase (NADPH)
MRKVIIIGSGPAGYTAAIYSARAGFAPLVFTGELIGGWLTTTTEVENFPGFPDGIMGPDLMEAMKKQAEKFGAEMSIDIVTGVDFSSSPLKVMVGERVEEAEAVIVATGSSARRLNVPGEQDLWGKGVQVCATCDGFFFKDKDIAVVGGGDVAMEEATFLTKFAKRVRILARGGEGELKASKPMLERALANEKIEIVYNTEVTEIIGDSKISAVKLKNCVTGEESQADLDGLFLAIGHIPNTDIFGGALELTRGYVKTAGDSTVTNVPGVFACGDVMDWKFRQAVTAAGTGCMAALEAQKYLDEKK